MRLAEHPAVTSAQVQSLGLKDCHEPTKDYTAPTQEQLDRMVSFISACLEEGEEGRPVAVSCGAGIGRTGTVLTCYLVNTGMRADEAIREVCSKRGTAYEKGTGQKEAIVAYAKRIAAS